MVNYDRSLKPHAKKHVCSLTYLNLLIQVWLIPDASRLPLWVSPRPDDTTAKWFGRCENHRSGRHLHRLNWHLDANVGLAFLDFISDRTPLEARSRVHVTPSSHCRCDDGKEKAAMLVDYGGAATRVFQST